MRVSVHVCSRDRHSEVGLLLQCLRLQSFQDFDVVLVDDASGSPISQCGFVQALVNRLKLEGHGVKQVRIMESRGVCVARNACIDHDDFGNPLVCRLDDDVLLERDFLERLHSLILLGADAASGIVPLAGLPVWKRPPINGKVINRHVFNENGELVRADDDCGYDYTVSGCYLTCHFRTNLMYKADTKVRYPNNLSPVGFREEGFFSIGLILEGKKIMVDTGAVAWHLQTLSGGCRRADYAECVASDDAYWRDWLKKLFVEHGDFLARYQDGVL